MTKAQLFVRLANFLKRNAELVADARDSNGPWALWVRLEEYERKARRKRRRK